MTDEQLAKLKDFAKSWQEKIELLEIDESSFLLEMTEKASRWDAAMRIVEQQAEDAALWFTDESASEAYLQQALRVLHSAIEGDLDG